VKKIKVGILFGGKSVEHEVSLQSARNVIEAIDRDKFDIVLIGINKDGQWLLNDSAEQFLIADSSNESLSISGNQVALIPESGGNLTSLTNIQSHSTLDVVFPLLHGTYGEDGTIQGLLKLANVPFVGAGVLASAVGLDKDVAKRLLRDAGIPVGQFIAIRSGDTIDTDHIIQQLGLPLFVKPANLGSSVGIRKVKDAPFLYEAIEFAFLYDNKVLIEAYIQGRELECAVLGNRDPVASIVGEVKAHHDFYSYNAKYIDEHGATLIVPADISIDASNRLREIAIRTFKVLGCEGMARVDFFITEDGNILVNEINTIPGFTNVSMYPLLWQASGVSYSDLIGQLIQLAIERHSRETKLRTSL